MSQRQAGFISFVFLFCDPNIKKTANYWQLSLNISSNLEAWLTFNKLNMFLNQFNDCFCRKITIFFDVKYYFWYWSYNNVSAWLSKPVPLANWHVELFPTHFCFVCVSLQRVLKQWRACLDPCSTGLVTVVSTARLAPPPEQVHRSALLKRTVWRCHQASSTTHSAERFLSIVVWTCTSTLWGSRWFVQQLEVIPTI